MSEKLEIFTSKEISSYTSSTSDEYCEKLSVRGMAISSYDIQQKTFEALNLVDSLPTFNSHRQIPSVAKFRKQDAVYSLSINTSRVTELAEKSTISELVAWSYEFEERINNNAPSTFLSRFSTSVSISSLKPDTKPVGLLMNGAELIEKVGNTILLTYRGKPIKRRLLQWLKRHSSEILEATEHDEKTTTFNRRLNISLIRNEKSFSIKSKFLSLIDVLDTQKNTTQSLLAIINGKGLFSVSFTDISYFYSRKRLYQDNNIIHGLKYLIEIFEPIESFSKARTEKGENFLSNGSTDFPTHSLFYRVQEYYRKKDIAAIICDDVGSEEWADHFIISSSQNPTISLVHSKASKSLSHGASGMQEVVGQAIKNIGKINLSQIDLDRKKAHWMGKYNAPNTNTNINRIMSCNKNYEHLAQHIAKIIASPKCVKEVVIAVNFIKKERIKKLEEKAKNGRLASYEAQLIWLLSSFVSACLDAGARPIILCRQ